MFIEDKIAKESMTTKISTPKIIFFDIDDTLSRNGIIAEHNKATLEQLADTDIKLVISTGRSKAILPEDILALLDADILDAIICMNGQYSFDKSGRISHYPLTAEQTDKIVRLCQQSDLIHKFDSATHIAWSGENERLREFNAVTPNSIFDPEYYKTNTVYQCSVFFNNQQEKMQDIDFAQYDLKLVHWHQIGADILPAEASKARGIKDVCEYYAVDASECMAFGDGMNDLEMFDLVGFAVAMGDAQPALIERADFVTGTIEEYGIQTVLNQLAMKS
ncbi:MULTISPECIES: Cof-type HAD-IIB family hydrolase [Psychrobacter]|jgi:Cof subfamily protein (haloacid dehalogenase superfamily)|uniref:Cof-type HAD-IIB family hydrolase n=1 Tax=Psychrobacter TaxID=497 RepID=UPI000AF4503B|nr:MULTISPECIES: Cof-type HAD-IIB family hydrolase [Psychrobacter]MBA6244588.1 Cof-type HAD-IIB family hydrolase [Psychrobacter sp. Urea-trap-18]MBA6285088.1 Cof-type HAD-IIB family hydrolase [Psychrobacter sp. Urea-trap-16]MBA6319491.1 Cof-type HAD-IIB family hydrolase [Psychrobacter sp. Urea-trap-20]MBA6334064.1 Cof-type HAD-IIB family hydrolase [Psychrobacter sp. Urea-trap-19]PKG59817.1 Cof-type HAD-IIB family hydrolase [Psychrobacter sp. Choline-3u-12]|tara:strand:- start:39 stop:869 length:831 start_codon:yes stop_codon:yes gene_type:complete